MIGKNIFFFKTKYTNVVRILIHTYIYVYINKLVFFAMQVFLCLLHDFWARHLGWHRIAPEAHNGEETCGLSLCIKCFQHNIVPFDYTSCSEEIAIGILSCFFFQEVVLTCAYKCTLRTYILGAVVSLGHFFKAFISVCYPSYPKKFFHSPWLNNSDSPDYLQFARRIYSSQPTCKSLCWNHDHAKQLAWLTIDRT